jgi:hypothetical protein
MKVLVLDVEHVRGAAVATAIAGIIADERIHCVVDDGAATSSGSIESEVERAAGRVPGVRVVTNDIATPLSLIAQIVRVRRALPQALRIWQAESAVSLARVVSKPSGCAPSSCVSLSRLVKDRPARRVRRATPATMELPAPPVMQAREATPLIPRRG